jgi:hypothetical protein
MLTKLLRKRGSGQGAVQESNPAVAERQVKSEKSKAQEPSLGPSDSHAGLGGIHDKIHGFSAAVAKNVKNSGGGRNVDSAHEEVTGLINKATKLHNEKKFSDAHQAMSNAFSRISPYSLPSSGGKDIAWKKDIVAGREDAIQTHRLDIQAHLNDYGSKAAAWHAENPKTVNRSLLEDI